MNAASGPDGTEAAAGAASTPRRSNAIPLRLIASIVASYNGRRGYIDTIMQRFHVPRKTAQRWVATARAAGHLPSMRTPRPCPRCGGTGVVAWGESRRA